MLTGRKAKRIKHQHNSTSDLLARNMWSLDWSSYLPKQLTENILVEKTDYQTANSFAQKHFSEIYSSNSDRSASNATSSSESHPARDVFYEHLGDFFIFSDSGRSVGLAVGTILDWRSYNFRNIALLPAYQDQGLYLKFFDLLSSVLGKHSVKSIEGDVAPTNSHHIHVLNKMGCVATAITISERWGAQLHFVRYLDNTDKELFREQFDGPYAVKDKHKNKLIVLKERE